MTCLEVSVHAGCINLLPYKGWITFGHIKRRTHVKVFFLLNWSHWSVLDRGWERPFCALSPCLSSEIWGINNADLLYGDGARITR